jgi:hypothetical protein
VAYQFNQRTITPFEAEVFSFACTFFSYDSQLKDVEFYRITVFERSGVGTPFACTDQAALSNVIALCIAHNFPFHVGHEFRMSLKETGR